MTIITPTGITGISSITSTGNTLQFQSSSGANLDVSGLNVTSGTNINVSGVVTATNFVGNVTGNVNSSGVSTVTTLRATSIVGVTTAGITTAYVGSINDGPISGSRNRIIGGNMEIDQRNAGATLPSVGAGSTFVVDRWSVYSGLGGIFRAGRSLNNVSPPVGFSSYLGLQNISVSSSNVNVLQQSIEGFNFADFDFGKPTAKPITVSFWMYSSVAGLHGGTFMNYAQTRIYPFSWNYTSPNTWQYVTITIPGDTSGTWVGSTNAGAASLIFCLGGGTGFFSGTSGAWISSGGGGTYGVSGQVNLANSSSSTFYLTGVQLESGTVATPFERRSYGQELALCQRYYEKSYDMATAPADGATADHRVGIGCVYNTNTYQHQYIAFEVRKRVAPTIFTFYRPSFISGTGTWAIYQNGGAWAAFTMTGLSLDESGFITSATLSSSSNAQALMCSGHWAASSEI